MRIGTRRSALALAQARLICEMLGGAEIVPMLASGDLDADRGAVSAPHAGGAGGGGGGGGAPSSDSDGSQPASDKSRWVDELEAALIAGEIDLAVHSAKDVPGELATGLALLGAPARASAEDVLCGASGLDELSAGARVGTGSIRRLAQLSAAREDLEVVAIRGNVDTRLRKLGDPDERLDAIVLARAGLQRLAREPEAGGVLDIARFVPAPGQGTLALQGRADDVRTREAVRTITDEDAHACLLAERALAHELGASCHTPLGAYALPAGRGRLHVRAWVGLADGSAWVSDELLGDRGDPEALGRRVAERLDAAGAAELLRQAEELAAS
jgi:hydroxymethylbilane synthase